MSDIRLAVVGDHNPGYETHRAIDHTLTLMPPGVEAAWHGSDQPLLGDLDAVWVAPGSPYRDDDAVYRTIEAARRHLRRLPVHAGRVRTERCRSRRRGTWRGGRGRHRTSGGVARL